MVDIAGGLVMNKIDIYSYCISPPIEHPVYWEEDIDMEVENEDIQD